MKQKSLILVIANDNPSVYIEMQSLWREWINKNKESCYCYFLKMEETGDSDIAIRIVEEENTIYIRGTECFIPGILEKTMIAIEYCLQCFPDISIFIRTNLSSVILLDKIDESIGGERDIIRGYTGQHFDHELNRYIPFISGAFICASREIWKQVLIYYWKDIRENKEQLYKRLPDDVCIGEYMGLAGILIVHRENRYWVRHKLTKNEVEEIKMADGICHIRCESYQHLHTVESMRDFIQVKIHN
jgi:hypothetical protein